MVESIRNIIKNITKDINNREGCLIKIPDIHTHLLPAMDDGSKDACESIAMLREEWAQGVSSVIATPHFYAWQTTPDDFIYKRDKAVTALKSKIDKNENLPKIALGAEVLFFEGISCCKELHKLRISGTNYILLEMPMALWNKRVLTEVRNIITAGKLTLVIAHIERYLFTQPMEMISELFNLNVLFQANAKFFYSKGTAGKAIKMLSDGYIHFIGSDCHGVDKRQPDIKKALKKLENKVGNENLANWIQNEWLLLQSVQYIDSSGGTL